MGKLLSWQKSTRWRYTYRYEKNKRDYERHFDSLNDAVDRGVDDLQKRTGIPLLITCDGKILMEPEDIHEAWSLRYLHKKPTP